MERHICADADTRLARLSGSEPIYRGWGRAENNYCPVYPVRLLNANSNFNFSIISKKNAFRKEIK